MAPLRFFRMLTLFTCASLSAQENVTITRSEINQFGQMQVDIQASPDSYYLLFCRHAIPDGPEWPVVMAKGVTGTLTLTDPQKALPVEHYRVSEYPVTAPGDYDQDGIDDITEFDDFGHRSPFNGAIAIDSGLGSVAIPDRATFEAFSYNNSGMLLFVSSLQGLEMVKFLILNAETDNPVLYFMNTKAQPSHTGFIADVCNTGKPSSITDKAAASEGMMKGGISYHPDVIAPGGSAGLYYFKFHMTDEFSFEEIQTAYELISRNMPFLRNNLSYYPMYSIGLPVYREEKERYDASRMTIYLEEELYRNTTFLPVNIAEGYGTLRLMSLSGQPNPRDVVIYDILPNDLSHVSGIITTVPQTPLSHVNLRAIQDKVPNAYIRNALEIDSISSLVGRPVYFNVTADNYLIREATKAETDAYYASVRPVRVTTPQRDLTVRKIAPLDSIRFEQWTSFGVKTANVATMRTFGFADGTIPNGFGVPFYFYDEFMMFNGLFDTIASFMSMETFLNDYAMQDSILNGFRTTIKKAAMPQWMLNELSVMQQSFPEATSIRCRSSTNNEDLPGFNGAGLYDSKTQHPDEGHIEKSIKQVYASLWNMRAFMEREFHRIDHFQTAMGVLVHPNYSGETANGVAVTTDPHYGTNDTYYLNTQLGENMVTNPDSFSIPEGLLLSSTSGNTFAIVQQSNEVDVGMKILADTHLKELRSCLSTIHNRFSTLYKARDDTGFAMEIEYKITADDRLAIKQARLWAGYRTTLQLNAESEPSPATAQRSLLVVSCRGGLASAVAITVTLNKEQPVTITVFNCLGRQVARLVYGCLPAGSHLLEWNAAPNPKGMYLLKVSTPEAEEAVRVNTCERR